MTDEKEIPNEHYVWRDVGGTDSNTRLMQMTLPAEKPVPEPTPEQQEQYEQLVKDTADRIVKGWKALRGISNGTFEYSEEVFIDEVAQKIWKWEEDNEK